MKKLTIEIFNYLSNKFSGRNLNNRKELFLTVNRMFAYCLLLLISGLLVYFILKNVSWTFSDITPMLHSIALGKIMPFESHINLETGRFTPFSGTDYNILLLFSSGDSPMGYYVMLAFYFIIFVIFIILLFKRVIIDGKSDLLKPWIIFFLVLYLIQRFYSPLFLNIEYSERLIIPLLTVFMYFTHKFFFTDKSIYALIAFICAVFTVYCKEIVFGVFIVFAIANLILWKNHLSYKNLLFHWALILNSVIFIILYYLIVFRHIEFAYYSGTGLSRLELILKVLRNQKLLLIGLMITILRLYEIFFKKDKNHIFLDSLLLSGLSFLFGCIFLRLEHSYYYSPAILLVSPAILYFLIYYIKTSGAFLVTFMFFALYVHKVVPAVQTNQEIRKIGYSIVEKIADFAKKGFTFYWYETTPVEYNYYVIYRDWNKSLLEEHIEFKIRDKSFKLQTINSIPQDFDDHSLFIYSNFNDSIGENKFKLEVKGFTTDTIAQLGGLTFLQLKR